MEKKSYAELLKDPRWQKKRLEIMQRDNFTCQLCGSESGVLNVHHKHYVEGRLPWEYEGGLLVTLCQDCHKKIHMNENSMDTDFELGDIVHGYHSDYEIYGIVYHIDYVNKQIHYLYVDSGASNIDSYTDECNFNVIKNYVSKISHESLYEDDYLIRTLFYCFYHVIKWDGYACIDYNRNKLWNALSLLKYNLWDIFRNNQCLYDLYLTAENGNIEYV